MSCYPKGKEPLCPVCRTRPLRERSASRCQECARGARMWATTPAPAPEPAKALPEPSAPGSFDAHWETFNYFIGRTPKPLPPPAMDPGRTHEIIHLADLHVPFHRHDLLREIVAETRGAGTCVVGGDFFNAGAFSRFLPHPGEIPVSPSDELAQARAVLQYLAQSYGRVVLRLGNHPDRIRKYFSARIPQEMMFLVMTDVLSFIARDLPNVEVAKPLLAHLDTSHWITMIGDCAFTHAETHGKSHLKPAQSTYDWLRRWTGHLPAVPKVICQEHNHRGAMAPSDDGQALLIQTPCLSRDVPYQFDAALKYGPNVTGYTRIVQDERGVTDWNLSRYYTVGRPFYAQSETDAA